MNTFFKMTMAGAAMFALSALAVPATSLVLAQTAAPTKAPELSKADQEEKNRTVAQIRSAVEKSKGGQDFKMALEKKDYKAVGAILIRHGAAADTDGGGRRRGPGAYVCTEHSGLHGVHGDDWRRGEEQHGAGL